MHRHFHNALSMVLGILRSRILYTSRFQYKLFLLRFHTKRGKVRFVWFNLIWLGFILFVVTNRLNMGLDLQSLFGLHVHCAQLYSLAETSQPPLRIWALLVSQDRRHFCVTSWCDSYHFFQEVECRILGRSKTGQTVEIR
jgi:hypothetical protein